MPPGFNGLVALLIALITALDLDLGAEPGSTSPVGTVRLGSGVTAHYAYHYNRNALTDLARSADAIIALTDSGNLLLLDAATFKLTREWFGPVPVTCLGRGERESVLAGFADGRVCRIDVATLAINEVARLPGKVQWVGAIAAAPGQAAGQRLVAVYEQTKKTEIRGRKFDVPYSVVQVDASGKTYPIEPKSDYPTDLRATAFLLDSMHRLWLGADNGEWGGWSYSVDLDAGKVHAIAGQQIYAHTPELKWEGVYGFSELRDGQVWAYGGTMHFGSSAFIWRVDQGKSERLYRLFCNPLAPDAGPKRRPDLPITYIVEDPHSGRITVIAYSDIYWADTRFVLWGKDHELEFHYRSGRRDAMGTYPSVRAVLPIEVPGAPLELIFATRFDGLIHLAVGKERGHALPGQLEAESIERIENSSEGTLVFEGFPGDDPVRFTDGAWKTVSFAPAKPVEINRPAEPEAIGIPAIPDMAEPDLWSESHVLVRRDGSIVTISASNSTPGTLATSFWRKGRAEVAGSELSSLVPWASFLTPDGTLWNADQGTLMRFSDGRWRKAGAFDWPRGPGRNAGSSIGWGLRTVSDTGPPWILHDRLHELLIRLSYKPQFREPRLEAVPIVEAGQSARLKIRDAIAWNRGELLLATDTGLRTLTIDGARTAAPALNTAGRPVSHLVRDRLGRLWLGGDGLAVLDADGKTLYLLDDLPMLGRTRIEALSADPAKADGAIAAIEGRGLLFVSVALPPNHRRSLHRGVSH